MADWGDAANCKTCLRTDQRGVGFAQGFASDIAGFGDVHLIAACGDEQNGLTGRFAQKDYGFRNLVDVTAHSVRCVLRGSRISIGLISRPAAASALTTRFKLLLIILNCQGGGGLTSLQPQTTVEL